jgi:hypothetical protein
VNTIATSTQSLPTRRQCLASVLALAATPALGAATATELPIETLAKPNWHPNRPYDKDRDAWILDNVSSIYGPLPQEQWIALRMWTGRVGRAFAAEVEYCLESMSELKLWLKASAMDYIGRFTNLSLEVFSCEPQSGNPGGALKHWVWNCEMGFVAEFLRHPGDWVLPGVSDCNQKNAILAKQRRERGQL